MSDLNELNDILFDTLRKAKDGNFDPNQAKSVIGISNSIISSGKLQLEAFKVANSAGFPKIMGLPEGNHAPQLPQAGAVMKEQSEAEGNGVDTKSADSEEKKELAKQNRHEAMLHFALEEGYKNTASAIAEMGGSWKFNKAFENWLEN